MHEVAPRTRITCEDEDRLAEKNEFPQEKDF